MAVFLIFSVFTLTSIALFPDGFSPFENWISDLGNSEYNPSGSMIFNIGCMITGISMALFFIGLKRHYTTEKNKRNMTLTLAMGLFSSFSLIMIGIFSEDYPQEHTLWSGIFFVALIIFMILANITLMKHKGFFKPIGYYAFVIIMLDLALIVTKVMGMKVPILEWLTVFASIIWILLLAYNIHIGKPSVHQA
ncbi:DUF998 domain-containing protein [Methanooceanicella nereidis]|uniref:DUF998 domain-containing protein n=1 Tax=Methanooceanicella nereidis TaxID=2052831 RepID=UPI001E2B1789|nr:DUF998 domain-containing protein [Methanocella sp. CWC-04]